MQAITAYKRIDLKKARKAAKKLHAMDHPLRKRIMMYIYEKGEITVTDIWTYFRIDQSVISQHLSMLRRAGWVNTNRMGKNIFYSVNENELTRVKEILSKFNEGFIE